ncbi:unnamed protein product [Acanthoscelides obtectus]|uniref:Uncharacterized protein n=1 Tax=Acanthoscelides obtectus TaxID=200917 RepID=A0A9P0LNM3_ACAOB|nr:unnamed protein product [Acanthoscelides obtectus]CAK1657269.1 hypothetical protein AOBTE_LOCUS20260 [Acanthoscelides obtectus]
MLSDWRNEEFKIFGHFRVVYVYSRFRDIDASVVKDHDQVQFWKLEDSNPGAARSAS